MYLLLYLFYNINPADEHFQDIPQKIAKNENKLKICCKICTVYTINCL